MRRRQITGNRFDPTRPQQRRDEAAPAHIERPREPDGNVVQPLQQPFRGIAQNVAHRIDRCRRAIAMAAHRAAIEDA